VPQAGLPRCSILLELSVANKRGGRGLRRNPGRRLDPFGGRSNPGKFRVEGGTPSLKGAGESKKRKTRRPISPSRGARPRAAWARGPGRAGCRHVGLARDWHAAVAKVLKGSATPPPDTGNNRRTGGRKFLVPPSALRNWGGYHLWARGTLGGLWVEWGGLGLESGGELPIVLPNTSIQHAPHFQQS